MNFTNIKLAHSYLDAKREVINAGFAREVDWQEDIRFSDLTETFFIEQYAWVVFSSGFRESILRRKFPEIKKAFFDFKSALVIAQNQSICLEKALDVFAHRGKIEAILSLSNIMRVEGFQYFQAELESRGVEFIDELPFMGPATSYHLAKNIGIDVVKPDRHLVRIARESGFDSPRELCDCIRDVVGDSLSVIDIVIWRYATIYPQKRLLDLAPNHF